MHRVTLSCLVVLALVTPVVGCGGDGTANRVPILRDQTAMTDEDVPVDLKVLDGASDPDGDKLTVISANAAGHHVDIVDGAMLRLTPAKDFHGTIEVNYAVTDGAMHDAAGKVIVTVRPINDAPVATGGSETLHGRHAVMLTGSDVDGDALSFEILQGPSHGTITGNGPALQYTPAAGFSGDDSISYRVSDGKLASQPVELALHVTPGASPVATAGNVMGDEDHQLAIVLGATDPDGDVVDFAVVTQPVHGTLGGTPPHLTYTPAQDFNGDDAIEFTVSDGYFTSDKATVTIHVAPVDDPPVATAQAVATLEDTAVDITLAGSDIDSDALSFRVVDPPQHGTLSSTTGAALSYTPAQDYNGPDHFTFVASDGTLDSRPATVDLNVAGAQDPPVAMSFDRSLNEDTSAPVTLVGSDPDSDPLTFAVVTQPVHGTLTGTPPNLAYTPAQDFNGDDSFTYNVNDGTATSAPGTVRLHVAPVNDAPVGADGTAETDEDTAVDIALHATDVDGDALSFSIVTPPADGTLTGTPPNLSYTPAANANGTRTLIFRVSDGHLTADATVTITIHPVNDAPVPADDFAGTDPGAALAIDVVANDFDIDGDTLALDAVDAPAHGTAEVVDGKLRYTPADGFTGIDTLGYTVIDGHGGSAHGTVHMGVGDFPAGAPPDAFGIGRIAAVLGASGAPAISNDGRFVALVTDQALVPEDTDILFDVYLYDRSTRTFTRVSTDSAGHPANASSVRPQLSGDARYIVFDSSASNLVAGDSNGKFDVFRHDRITGETIRVSVATDGSESNGSSSDAEISDDGNLVVFTSTAFNLVEGDANGVSDVFVRDIAAGTTRRVSNGLAGGDADFASSDPTISRNGRFVAFTSSATNLVGADSNGKTDVFVYDRNANRMVRGSVSTNGSEANGNSSGPSLSRDGRFVSFLSSANNLVGTFAGGFYVRDLPSQTTSHPSSLFSPLFARISGDGRFLVEYASVSVGQFDIQVVDRFVGESRVLGPVTGAFPAISDNARYIVMLDGSGSGRLIIQPNPFNP